MPNRFFEKPILNSPYQYPTKHWELDAEGQPTQRILHSRRLAEFITPIPKPRKRKTVHQQEQFIFDEGQGLSTQEQQYDPTPIMRHQEFDRLALKQATGADVQYVLSENEVIMGTKGKFVKVRQERAELARNRRIKDLNDSPVTRNDHNINEIKRSPLPLSGGSQGVGESPMKPHYFNQ